MIAGTEDEKLSLAFRILNVSSYTCKTQEIISNHVTGKTSKSNILFNLS
jgi:hypothetical protein